MTNQEKRKNSRTASLRLLNYVAYDKVEVETAQGMGRTLNVSESGIMLETHHPLNVDQVVSLKIGFEEKVVDVRGRVIYTRQNSEGMYQSGIEFCELDNAVLLTLRQYSAAFNSGRDNHS
jgi:hypothetical protein